MFVARRGRSELTTTILSSAQVRDLVEKLLKSSGRRIHMSSPFARPRQHAEGAQGESDCAARRPWRAQVLAYFDTDGLSNGDTEAINMLIEKARRLAHGYATSPTTGSGCSSSPAGTRTRRTSRPTT